MILMTFKCGSNLYRLQTQILGAKPLTSYVISTGECGYFLLKADTSLPQTIWLLS